MNTIIKRIYVEKIKGFDSSAKELFNNLRENLRLERLKKVRILNRYDIQGIEEELFEKSKFIIFSQPNVDRIYNETFPIDEDETAFGVEYIPGQYDQRADSAVQAIKILSEDSNPIVNTAKIIVVKGISKDEIDKVKRYIINPVDSREASLNKPKSLEIPYKEPSNVKILNDFINEEKYKSNDIKEILGLAMNNEDIDFIREYFRINERRNPTITEIRVIDTYWSDHCRHTTFMTNIEGIEIEDGYYKYPIEEAYNKYLESRKFVYKNEKRNITLMDVATIAMKEMRKKGLLNDLEVSEEINAASIVVEVDIDGEIEEWLVMFKNETHNHPTEIEPFGGAATCLGGAIRDPLSGRSYVYGGMRITGSGDPTEDVSKTLVGKLPQIKITTEAAKGFSSYGNQIGLATGQVSEVYDEGFIAKRMEVGAVIAAAPKDNVIRKTPEAGDVVILLGGKTGRDGCGGATGSSKEHDETSLMECGSEVQKGNPPEERKIQRLFRNKEAPTLIKKSNDFGAGGVSVAIGELAPSIYINLDKVPKKYNGLDGTELAISESQERMAVVVDRENSDKFKALAEEENLEATIVAEITDNNRLIMEWRGKKIVDLDRSFLDTNGAVQRSKCLINNPSRENSYFDNYIIVKDGSSLKDIWLNKLRDLNIADQKGLRENFDSTIGASTVILPYGGKYGLTPAEGMVSKIPVLKGETNTCTIMTYGYNPKIAKWSPFHGGMYSVLHSIAKVIALGGELSNIRLTLQEYFEKLGKSPEKWGKPLGALLGALQVQKELDIPAIGGKDSMSGTFKDIDVPPTLVSFAVASGDVRNIVSQEIKKTNSSIVLLEIEKDDRNIPKFNMIKKTYTRLNQLIKKGKILSCHTLGHGGIAEAITKMSIGNKIGVEFIEKVDLFKPDYGSLIIEIDEEDIEELNEIRHKVIGRTIKNSIMKYGEIEIDLEEMVIAFQEPLEKVFPRKGKKITSYLDISYTRGNRIKKSRTITKPKVFIPIFPGTNCEYDMKRAFEKVGGEVETFIFKNQNPKHIKESIYQMKTIIDKSQIIALPGGFSAGDEPDGSGKFIATIFRNSFIKESISNLLENRDGLILGICNGFQVLIKLGLLPYGKICNITKGSPTLTFNKDIGHISTIAKTRVSSNLSPWLNGVNVGDIHDMPISHGEGRFVASDDMVEKLINAGQIATQYIDFNPNGSTLNVEGITSPDGRIFGKMGHSERIGRGLYKNKRGNYDQKIFESGINYYK
ncbi:phosphoribosylformylglycinamidine synthase [Clostridium sp. D2Q-14]|uniref:phosphoribosylformylglycinamidine synthase n=1 Tax=Anaeromonas gelatinilytica TaxID=2683194 RepID=UPI00193BEC65|nr:phosphoribosylformylglycinamidine synthase [Anaeromonas gelatinilytica]MBS4534648.1 phosphoribosylformylglycinamidine synthase [Anaeromonas gelatinilytica]